MKVSYLHTLLTLINFCFFDNSHSDMNEVIYHWVLICIVLIFRDIKTPFHQLLAINLYSLEKCLFRPSAYFLKSGFFFLILSCISSLYILGIDSPPFPIYSMQISSPIQQFAFHFIHGFLQYVKVYFSFTQSYLLNFALVALVSGDRSKQILLRLMSKNINLCFLLGGLQFQVLRSSVYIILNLFLYMV